MAEYVLNNVVTERGGIIQYMGVTLKGIKTLKLGVSRVPVLSDHLMVVEHENGERALFFADQESLTEAFETLRPHAESVFA